MMVKSYFKAHTLRRVLLTLCMFAALLPSPLGALVQKGDYKAHAQTRVLQDGTSDVRVHFVDVGLGDCILIETPNKNVLIDGGLSAAGQTILDYLQSLNINRIHLMIATHPHEDHIGGLITVLNSSTSVDQVLFNNDYVPIPPPAGSTGYPEFIALATSHNLTVAQRGQIFQLSENVNLTVLNPTQPLQSAILNDNSIVVKLQAGNSTFLFTGDATAAAEQGMLGAGLAIQSDVLKVCWHGGWGSTTTAFLEGVAPSYAIVTAGYPNKYGICFPDPAIVDRILANKIVLFETQAHGTIIASTGGDSITFSKSRIPLNLGVSTIPLSASIWKGQSVGFTSNVSGGTQPYRYQWYLNGTPVQSLPILGLRSWSFRPQSIGKYAVYLKILDNLGNTTESNEALVSVAAFPGDVTGDLLVDIQDATQIGFYWMATVPPAPANADVTGDGIINIKDATIVGVNWQKHA